MPERRLVLHVAEADLASARLRDVDDPGVSVVLVVPSVTQLLQAGWVDDLAARRWSTFAAWLDAALSGGLEERRGWRYDEVVAAWVDVLGAGRVQVSLGGAGVMEASVAVLRALSWAEVGLVDALVAELGDLELGGRNAAEMVSSGVDRLRRADVEVPLGGSPLPQALQDRIAATARAMAARLDALDVLVTGDRSALDWPPGGVVGGTVGLGEATLLAMGALEQVSTWGREKTA